MSAHVVVAEDDGRSAIKLVLRSRPELLVLDVMSGLPDVVPYRTVGHSSHLICRR